MDGVAGFEYEENTYIYRKNVQGDITHIYKKLADGTLELVARYVYDAWGNHDVLDAEGKIVDRTASVIANVNPFRYRGYYFDVETGLYYLQTRYYDPELGRFISSDDVSYLDPETLGGLNLYAYCANNPVMNVDPTGKFLFTLLACAIAGAIVGTVLGGIYGAATAAANGQDIGWGIFIGAVSGLFLGAIAGAAGALMSPLLAGASLVGTTLTAGTAFAIGLSVAVVGGFAVGFSAELAIQAANGQPIDLGAAAISGAQASLLTVVSSLFGTLGSGFIDSLCVSFGSGILTSTFNMLIDVIKYYFSKKESSSINLKASYGI